MRIARTGRSYQTGRLAILIYTIFLSSFSQGCPGIIQSLTGYRLLIAEKMPMGSLSFKASVSHPPTHLQSIWSYQRNNLPSQFLVSTFIQSFILAISIAPLQVHYYSEALSTTAWILYRSFTPKRTGNCRYRTCTRSLRGG